MCKIKTLNDCKTGRDLRVYVERHPDAHDIRQCGSHVSVKGPKPGTAVFPDHGHEQLQRGTLGSAIKMLIRIGLGALLLLVAFSAMGGGLSQFIH